MKTAISIPDKLFQSADQYARQKGISRSHLYAQAVAQFLETHSAGQITKQLDEVYSSQPAEVNAMLASLQFSSVEREKW